MLDDERDKQLTRNHTIAIILMTITVVVWFQFFAPEPPVRQPAPAGDDADRETTQLASTPEDPTESGGLVVTPPEMGEEGAWPNLPPVAEAGDAAQDEIQLSDEHLELTFTRVGARLKRARVLVANGEANNVQLVPQNEGVPDADAVYPLGIRFSDEAIGDAVDRRRFDVKTSPKGDSLTFSLTLPGYGVVRKTVSFTERAFVLSVTTEFENLDDEPRRLGKDYIPAYILSWAPELESHDDNKGIKKTLIWRAGDENDTLQPGKLPKNEYGAPVPKTIPNGEWMAAKSAYFMVAFHPDYDDGQLWAAGHDHRYRFGVGIPRFVVEPGARETHTTELYVGPMRLDTLAAAWPTLETSLRFFERFDSMDWFSKLLLRMLNWFHEYIPNYGVAIILLTVVVRVLMFPLTLKSMKSMKKMQMLAPELEPLKEKYKDDPQEMNKKMMELYRERGINPLGGCFPILLQMPIFMALYRMLWNAYELRGAPFLLWIDDLSEPDRLLHLPFMEALPFIGATFSSLNLLPILMAFSMVASQKLMPASGPMQNPQQKFIMTFMPIFFALICYNMAAGLNLYILTSTLLGIVQNYFVRVAETPEDLAKKTKKTPRKKQHFYTAAKARQRESAREAKRAKNKEKARQR